MRVFSQSPPFSFSLLAPREIEAERRWQSSKDVNDNKRSGLLFAYDVESHILYLYFPCYTFMHSLCVCTCEVYYDFVLENAQTKPKSFMQYMYQTHSHKDEEEEEEEQG